MNTPSSSPIMTLPQDKKTSASGKLKIFLGMAAGVGKTYAMLREAKELKIQGIDVVAGIVETHQRKETLAQLAGLEILPRRVHPYKNKEIEEFDLDGALQRNPQVILVDELAHTNAPGCRNNKRYIDILELLHAGIDVYTAVNVQHIESRSHTVTEITQAPVRETVPDSFFDLADEIIVIDLPPEDLLLRLQNGLIYPADRASLAQENFFQTGNLTALRELALRAAAERVDKDLRNYRMTHNIQEIWKSSHRLLVAVFASPYAENLIRSTRRLADTLNASWIGAYIDDNHPLSSEEKTLLARNIALVQELGGEVITSREEDTAEGLLRIARQNNVTEIVIGKSGRSWWNSFFSGGSLVNRLLRSAGDIDIYSISYQREDGKKNTRPLPETSPYTLPIHEMGIIAALGMGSWFVAGFLEPMVGYMSIGFLFLLVVCLSGLYLSRTSMFFMATLFAGIHDFFFIPPVYTFSIRRSEDFMMLSMFFLSAAIIGHVTHRLGTREKNLLAREALLISTYSLAKNLLAAKGVQEVIRVGVLYLEQAFPYQILVLYRYQDTEAYGGSWSLPFLSSNEKAVIDWVITQGQHAGKFTQTLSASDGYYIPLVGKSGTLGLIGINSKTVTRIEAEQLITLENLSHQLSSALERELPLLSPLLQSP